MSILSQAQLSDSPLVESITYGRTLSDGSCIRPAEANWHMVLVKHDGRADAIVVGPLSSSGIVSWGEGGEVLWVKFKLGVFMPHLPTRKMLDKETLLPDASSKSFWLHSSTWEFPNYENIDTFLARLARNETLVQDPVITAALEDQIDDISSRTLRHRFLHVAGLSQSYIRQFKRAQRAQALLTQGVPILDTVEEAGYFDQPHLTRSLKQFIGYTPAQTIRIYRPDCHSIQDLSPGVDYNATVLTASR